MGFFIDRRLSFLIQKYDRFALSIPLAGYMLYYAGRASGHLTIAGVPPAQRHHKRTKGYLKRSISPSSRGHVGRSSAQQLHTREGGSIRKDKQARDEQQEHISYQGGFALVAQSPSQPPFSYSSTRRSLPADRDCPPVLL